MGEILRIAYADPPYVGQARRHYKDDPSGIPAEEVDYEALFEELKTYDAFALSASSPSLHTLLPLAPKEVRIGAWVKPFASWKPTNRVQYAWEPVLFIPARPRGTKLRPSVRDWVSANITLRKGTHGAKPDAFNFWIFDLLGLESQDEFFDLYPGSGGVTRCWEEYRSRAS
jgi:hypothetical protein